MNLQDRRVGPEELRRVFEPLDGGIDIFHEAGSNPREFAIDDSRDALAVRKGQPMVDGPRAGICAIVDTDME